MIVLSLIRIKNDHVFMWPQGNQIWHGEVTGRLHFESLARSKGVRAERHIYK